MTSIKSALYIDFDNIYTRLGQLKPSLAENFATSPDLWLAWLESQLPVPDGEASRRRILVRKCYLNPNAYNRFRPFFVKSAFNVVDCPPLTTQGKNSADIHMVLDIVEALEANPGYDEFIIFSGDADFTPVLIKLREKDKMTSILSVGASSPAYRAAATQVISEHDFTESALSYCEFSRNGQDGELNDESRQDVSQFVIQMVRNSATPIVMANLAHNIRKKYSDAVFEDWCGGGKFIDFLKLLDLNGLKLSEVVPGYVYDPEIHTPPKERTEIDLGFGEDRELLEFARLVSKLTGAPLLGRDTYRQLYEIMSDEIRRNGYQLSSTSRNIRDTCKDKKLSVSRQQINFVLIGLGKVGCRLGFGECTAPAEISRKFCENIFNLCTSSQMNMGENANKLFKWLLIDEALHQRELATRER
ncbi:hypothetical protein GGQ74_002838 [Desulfobaculum xiamenense]|uniref:NYN domain-containing protein n=1 Tax=Desulfobaculum xiamenense TaxID=995050 RepID=A0A846QM10_9BACT|nr:NYN domain-containing protein [Desulfobaculum xiamenense]NJB69141.1 hypothetical protein [Desulfobaculum xiamenense]